MKNQLIAKRANYANRLDQCDTDHEVKLLVLSTGQPHALIYDQRWTPAIGQFIIRPGSELAAPLAPTCSMVDAEYKARELWRQWKKDVKKAS